MAKSTTGTHEGGFIDHMMAHPEPYWVALAFVLFIAFALWKVVPGLKAGLQGYADEIKKNLDEAEALKNEANQVLQSAKAEYSNAENQAKEIIKGAKSQAKEMAKNAEKELSNSVAKREEQAVARIAQLEAEAEREITDIMSKKALELAEQKLVKELTAAQKTAFNKEAIESLKAA